MTLLCGTSITDVTPPADLLASGAICTIGFWYDRALPLRTVRDPISARILYLNNGTAPVAIISWESLGDAVGMRDRVRSLLAPADTGDIVLFFACTHSHTVPDTLNLCGKSQPDEYLDWVAGQIAGGILAAHRNAAPVSRIACSTGIVEGLANNRRPLMKSGKVAVLESDPDPNDIADPGVTDNRITSLRLYDSNGTMKARIVHFACHPVHMQAVDTLSPGYPGLLSRLFESQEAAVTLYLNGACGDVNPTCMGEWEYAESFARTLHEQLTQSESTESRECDKNGLCMDEAIIRVRRRTVDVPPEPAAGSTITTRVARTDAEWRHGGEGWQQYLNQQKRHVAAMPDTLEVPLAVLRIGNVILAGVAGEIFARDGLKLRNAAPGSIVLPVSYVNGYRGYLAPREAFAHEGYEVQCAPWSVLEVGETERIVETLRELTQRNRTM